MVGAQASARAAAHVLQSQNHPKPEPACKRRREQAVDRNGAGNDGKGNDGKGNDGKHDGHQAFGAGEVCLHQPQREKRRYGSRNDAAWRERADEKPAPATSSRNAMQKQRVDVRPASRREETTGRPNRVP